MSAKYLYLDLDDVREYGLICGSVLSYLRNKRYFECKKNYILNDIKDTYVLFDLDKMFSDLFFINDDDLLDQIEKLKEIGILELYKDDKNVIFYHLKDTKNNTVIFKNNFNENITPPPEQPVRYGSKKPKSYAPGS